MTVRNRSGIAGSLAALLVAGCMTQTSPSAVPSPLQPPPATEAPPAASASAPVPATTSPAWAGSHPNILLIIADDFGLDVSPCHNVGFEKPFMPNLARLCLDGLVFDNAWVSPMCSPTRATILTGQYGFRTGVLTAGNRLRPTASIQDELTAGAGYANALIGKWHLTTDPAEFGVQHYAAFLDHQGSLEDYSDFEITEDGVKRRITQYATSAFTDMAIDWIAAQRQPWFLWLAYNAPHAPHHVPPPSLHPGHDLPGGDDIRTNPRDYFFAAAEAMDKEMGRLLDSIPPMVREQTVVIFVGDNGSPTQVVQAPYGPRMAKRTVYQGGVNAPIVIAGAGVSRRGEREDALVNGTDLFATIAQLAGSPVRSVHDSVSFADALVDSSFEGRTHTYAEYENPETSSWAVRDARYKLISQAFKRYELYDLESDPFERQNLVKGGVPPELHDVVQGLLDFRSELLASPG